MSSGRNLTKLRERQGKDPHGRIVLGIDCARGPTIPPMEGERASARPKSSSRVVQPALKGDNHCPGIDRECEGAENQRYRREVCSGPGCVECIHYWKYDDEGGSRLK